jgi:hypothetical protein
VTTGNGENDVRDGVGRAVVGRGDRLRVRVGVGVGVGVGVLVGGGDVVSGCVGLGVSEGGGVHVGVGNAVGHGLCAAAGAAARHARAPASTSAPVADAKGRRSSMRPPPEDGTSES